MSATRETTTPSPILAWLGVLGMLGALALVGPAPLAAQQEAVGEQPEEQAGAPLGVDRDEEQRRTVDAILEAEAEAMAGEGASYDPAGRRDPFRSLLERPPLQRCNEEVISCLTIEDIELTGIFVTAEGRLAQIHSSVQRKSYLLREGDELYDGDVVRITPGEVVFKQNLEDATILGKPFREVVKKLNP